MRSSSPVLANPVANPVDSQVDARRTIAEQHERSGTGMSHPPRTVATVDEEAATMNQAMGSLAFGGVPAGAPETDAPPRRPQLRVITGGRHPAAVRRRRALVSLLAGLTIVVAAVGGRALASPTEEAPTPVAGHATIAPGETLWDVAVANAPAGTDPRAYLEQLRRLNGIDDAPIPAWTVVLLPASG